MTVAPVCSDDVCESVFVSFYERDVRNIKVALTIAVSLWNTFEITRITLDGISRNFIIENNLKFCPENSMFIEL